jgi:two-component system OmpR family sensor kinase
VQRSRRHLGHHIGGDGIVREIAQAHDAALALEEREGGGLRVVLRFPFRMAA